MTFEEVAERARAFRDEREWSQFHNPKDLAMSVSIEAGELLEVFQWSGTDLNVPDKAGKAAEELADVAIYCIYLADALGIDLPTAINSKIDLNAQKYPVKAARGNARKYDEL